MRIEAKKGDSIDINGSVAQDITGWSIRAEIWDNTTAAISPFGPNSIKKATSDITGGAVDQIEVTNVTTGTFIIYVDAGETTSMKGDIMLEIEVEDNTSPTRKRFTIYRDFIHLFDEQLTWTDVT